MCARLAMASISFKITLAFNQNTFRSLVGWIKFDLKNNEVFSSEHEPVGSPLVFFWKNANMRLLEVDFVVMLIL